MKRPWLLLIGMALLMAGLLIPRVAALQETPPATLYRLLNYTRLREGLTPLSESTLLKQAAQRHANDIAERGTATHEGSDGSGYRQRIRETGYRAWNDGLLVGETFWMGLGTAEDALNWFRNNPGFWEHLMDPRYREVGIGYAEDDQGVHYFVINLGARPNVLPVFINDGAATTDSPQVAVRLTNEEAEPLGEGTWIGRAIEVRMSHTPDFGDAPWMPWEPLLPWLLSDTAPGEYAVYVQYRDGANRTAIAEDVIRLVGEGEVAPTPPGDMPPPIAPPPDDPPPPIEEPSDNDAPPSPDPLPEPTEIVVMTPTPLPPVDTSPDAPLPEVAPTWTPLPEIEEEFLAPARPVDWPVLLALGLQAIALLLGGAVFLRRR